MKKHLSALGSQLCVAALLCLCVLSGIAHGQALSSGSPVFSGSRTWGQVLNFYHARVDNCSLGTESGCCGVGLNPACSGSTHNAELLFQLCPVGSGCYYAPPFLNLAPFNTGVTDPDFHSHLIMVTDTTTKTTTNTFNMGEDNDDTDVFSSDSSMFYVHSNGSGPYVFYLNAAAIRAQPTGFCTGCLTKSAIVGGTPGLALTSVNGSGVYLGSITGGASNALAGSIESITGFTNAGNNLTNATVTASSNSSLTFSASTTIETAAARAICGINCTAIDSGIGQSFSRVASEPNILYELQSSGAAAGLVINRLAICRNLSPLVDLICSGAPISNPSGTATDTFTRTPYANFADPTYGVLPSDYQSLWTGTFGISDDGSITLPEGGAGSYRTIGTGGGGAQAVTPDTFILPVNNNGKITATSPTWSTGSVTVTITTQLLASGHPILVAGFVPSAYNGTFTTSAVSWSGSSGTATYPLASNPGACSDCSGTLGNADSAFQASSGTTSGTELNWNTYCQTIGSTCSDGSVTWTNIGNLNGQGPGFDVLNFRPATAIALGAPSAGYSRINTRLAKVYRGFHEGSSFPSSGTADPAGSLTTDDALVCAEFGTNPCPWNETGTLHGSATLPLSAYAPYTLTGGGGTIAQAQIYTPQNTVPQCLPTSSNYRAAWVSSPSPAYGNNDAVYDPADGAPYPLYVANGTVTAGVHPASNSGTGSTQWATSANPGGPVFCYHSIWQTNSTIVRACMMRGTTGFTDAPHCPGHEVHGALGDAGDALMNYHLWSRPTVAAGIGAGAPGATANPGTQFLPSPNGIPGDQHGTWRNAGTSDLTPAGSANTDVPASTYSVISSQNSGQSAGYNEFVGIKPDGSGIFYRWAHCFSTGSESDFSAQNCISVISQDGQWAVMASDMMGFRGSKSPAWSSGTYTLGTFMFPISGTIASNTINAGNYDFQVTTAGTSGGSQPGTWCQTAGCTVTDGSVTWTNIGTSCNQLRAQFSPAPSTAFSTGNVIFPVDTNASYFQYQATNNGTTGSSLPNWNNFCGAAYAGQSCPSLDGTVQWFNEGANDCRADIVLVDLLSAD